MSISSFIKTISQNKKRMFSFHAIFHFLWSTSIFLHVDIRYYIDLLVSFIESHGDVFLRNVLSLYDVTESTFSDWITAVTLCSVPVVPVPGVLPLLSTSSSLIVHIVVLMVGVLLGLINCYHCYLCG